MAKNLETPRKLLPHTFSISYISYILYMTVYPAHILTISGGNKTIIRFSRSPQKMTKKIVLAMVVILVIRKVTSYKTEAIVEGIFNTVKHVRQLKPSNHAETPFMPMNHRPHHEPPTSNRQTTFQPWQFLHINTHGFHVFSCFCGFSSPNQNLSFPPEFIGSHRS